MTRHSGPISQKGGLNHVRVHHPEWSASATTTLLGTTLCRTTGAPVHLYTGPGGRRAEGEIVRWGMPQVPVLSAPDRQPRHDCARTVLTGSRTVSTRLP